MIPDTLLSGALPRALLLALTAVVPAGAQQGFQHALPGDTLAFVGVDDATEYGASWSVSSLGRFWASEKMALTRERIEEDLRGIRAKLEEELGADPLLLPGMVEGAFGVALLDLSISEDGDPDEPDVAVCLLADVGENAQECRNVVDRLVEKMMSEEPHVVLKREDVGGVDVSTLVSSKEHADPLSIRFGFHGTIFVGLLQYGELARDPFLSVVDGLDGRNDVVLADAPAFRDSLASGEHGGVRLFGDLGGVLGTIFDGAQRSGELDAEESALIDSLGLRDMGVMSMSMTCGERQSTASMRLDWPGDGWIQRIMRHVCVPGEFRTLRYVSSEANGFTALRVDLPSLFDTVSRMLIDVKAIAPGDLVKFLTDAETELGFNPRDDLLELFSGEFVLVADEVGPTEQFPFSAGDPVNYSLVLGLTDGEAFTTLVDGLIRKYGFHVGRKSEEFQGFTLYQVPIPMLPVSLGYSVTDDMCVLSLSPTMLRDVLRRKASSDLGSVLETQKFKDAVAGLDYTRQGMLAFSDTAADMKSLLRTLRHLPDLIGDDPDADDPLHWLARLPLPEEAVIDDFFTGGTATTCRIDAQGMVFESVGP